MSPYVKTEEKKHYNLDKNNNQPFPNNNPWGMYPNQPMNNRPYNQPPNPGHKPKQQPKHDNQPPFNPWNVLPGFRPNVPIDGNPSHNKKPGKYDNNPRHQPQPPGPPPGYNPHKPEQPNNNLHWQEPPDYSPPRQEPPEGMVPDNYAFNPWGVLPAFRPNLQQRPDRKPPKRIIDRKPPKKIPNSGPGEKDPSLKYIPAPVIKEYIGQVINTYISGYGRINVYVKGINRNGMVHLVILDPKPSDYIYIHNSDLVGIAPPTL